jgi:hypothetical protein
VIAFSATDLKICSLAPTSIKDARNKRISVIQTRASSRRRVVLPSSFLVNFCGLLLEVLFRGGGLL